MLVNFSWEMAWVDENLLYFNEQCMLKATLPTLLGCLFQTVADPKPTFPLLFHPIPKVEGFKVQILKFRSIALFI